jgi:hypothetical protein
LPGELLAILLLVMAALWAAAVSAAMACRGPACPNITAPAGALLHRLHAQFNHVRRGQEPSRDLIMHLQWNAVFSNLRLPRLIKNSPFQPLFGAVLSWGTGWTPEYAKQEEAVKSRRYASGMASGLVSAPGKRLAAARQGYTPDFLIRLTRRVIEELDLVSV